MWKSSILNSFNQFRIIINFSLILSITLILTFHSPFSIYYVCNILHISLPFIIFIFPFLYFHVVDLHLTLSFNFIFVILTFTSFLTSYPYILLPNILLPPLPSLHLLHSTSFTPPPSLHLHQSLSHSIQAKISDWVAEVRSMCMEYKEKLETLGMEDRLIEKYFKKTFHDATAVQYDNLVRLFKRRPRLESILSKHHFNKFPKSEVGSKYFLF